ncbi:hypothetical protein SOVF_121090, partial [Spinacia oleracea]
GRYKSEDCRSSGDFGLPCSTHTLTFPSGLWVASIGSNAFGRERDLEWKWVNVLKSPILLFGSVF